MIFMRAFPGNATAEPRDPSVTRVMLQEIYMTYKLINPILYVIFLTYLKVSCFSGGRSGTSIWFLTISNTR
jgi:hypothetical protein